MILVDSSVWIEHLSRGVEPLIKLLENGEVTTHPFIIGELACGNLRKRQEILHYLQQLPTATVATDSEVLEFIDERGLAGLGVGYVDAHILASTVLSAPLHLWTRDKRMAAAAADMGIVH